jgi:hypothetical protein
MLNNIFKLLFLIIGICIAIILIAIDQKEAYGRYQVATSGNHTVIIDTKTGVVYDDDGNGGYIMHKDGQEIKLAKLPD